MHKVTRVISWVMVGTVGFGLAALLLPRASGAADEKPAQLKSAVVSWDKAPAARADWGEIRFHFRGETLATRDVLTAVAVIKPGMAIHNPHRHAEEEYLMITEGSGVWHLDGKAFPAEQGDVLFVEPWVYHGLTNTGDKPLTFVVFKYNGKGIKLPPRPKDGRPDEL